MRLPKAENFPPCPRSKPSPTDLFYVACSLQHIIFSVFIFGSVFFPVGAPGASSRIRAHTSEGTSAPPSSHQTRARFKNRNGPRRAHMPMEKSIKGPAAAVWGRQ